MSQLSYYEAKVPDFVSKNIEFDKVIEILKRREKFMRFKEEFDKHSVSYIFV
jgi:hypothetical protein